MTNNTEFQFVGLDAGTYYLQEVIAPSGYQAIDPQKVIIAADTGNTQDDNSIDGTELASLELTSPVSVTFENLNVQSCLSFEVQNSLSFLLPATGGIGTKLFLISGCSMTASHKTEAGKCFIKHLPAFCLVPHRSQIIL